MSFRQYSSISNGFDLCRIIIKKREEKETQIEIKTTTRVRQTFAKGIDDTGGSSTDSVPIRCGGLSKTSTMKTGCCECYLRWYGYILCIPKKRKFLELIIQG